MDAVKILMADGCTEHDAKRHLKRGAMVYESFDEWFQVMKDNGLDGDLPEDAEQAFLDGRIEDLSAVTVDGKTYAVEYVL